MKPSRRSRSKSKRAEQRGVVALEELFSTAALLACFVGPVAVAARSIGPDLAHEMDSRVHAVKEQEPSRAKTSTSANGGLEFGGVGGSELP